MCLTIIAIVAPNMAIGANRPIFDTLLEMLFFDDIFLYIYL